MDGPYLWFLNRSTGFVLLGMFTLTTALGVLAMGERRGRWVPRFVTQAFHRNLALLSMVALGLHAATAVADTFVDIRWWQALVPYVGSTYQPLWLGLGALALDLLLVVALTSVLRTRMRHRSWRAVHLLAYAAWALSMAHGLGIGTDVADRAAWAIATSATCAAVVLLAVLHRLVGLLRPRELAAVR